MMSGIDPAGRSSRFFGKSKKLSRFLLLLQSGIDQLENYNRLLSRTRTITKLKLFEENGSGKMHYEFEQDKTVLEVD